MSVNEFYMVIKASGASVPSKRHPTFDEAFKEASRLAVNTGEQFYILSPQGLVDPPAPVCKYIPLNNG